MKHIALALVLWLFAATGLAGPAAAQQAAEPRAWTERLLGLLVTAGPAAAHNLIARESLFAQRNGAAIKSLLQPMLKTEAAYGPAQEFELVAEKPLGTSVVLLSYIVRHDTRPLVWEFDFYRRNQGWDRISFRFADNLARLPRR